MPLPKLDLPIFDLNLPSTGEKVHYRPFTVKEEKILLMAQESKEPKQVIDSMKQIVNNCLVKGKTIDDLTLFDLEYLLVNIRARSVDNKINFKINDPDTEEEIELELDLSQVKIEKNNNHTNKIQISDEYTLFLKYPKIDDFFNLVLEENPNAERQFEVMLSCLDKLVSEDEVYNFKDFTNEEINEFVEGLHSDMVKEIKKFFDTIPKIRHEIEYKNSKGDDKTFVIQGTQTFFI